MEVKGLDIKFDFPRRLREVMDEKHKEEKEKTKFVENLSIKLNVSLRTTYRIIGGSRYVKPSEQETIAEVLGISLERLLQKDTDILRKKIEDIFRAAETMKIARGSVAEKDRFNRLKDLADEMVEIAIGLTERFDAKNELGKVYFEFRKFKEAHNTWVEAYDLAKTASDTERLYKVCNNLLHSSKARKRISDVERILVEAEPFFVGDYEKLGRIKYFQAVLNFETGDYEEALTDFEASHEFYIKTGNQVLIGLSEHNLGKAHYKLRHYSQARGLYTSALSKIENASLSTRLITQIELVKTLDQLGHQDEAKRLALQSLDQTEANRMVTVAEMRGRLLMLLSQLYRDPTYAIEALDLELDAGTLLEIHRYLHDFYLRSGDARTALYYHERVLNFNEDEEGYGV